MPKTKSTPFTSVLTEARRNLDQGYLNGLRGSVNAAITCLQKAKTMKDVSLDDREYIQVMIDYLFPMTQLTNPSLSELEKEDCLLWAKYLQGEVIIVHKLAAGRE